MLRVYPETTASSPYIWVLNRSEGDGTKVPMQSSAHLASTD